MIRRTARDGSTGWHWQARVRRIEVGFHVWRHQYATTPDRWVVQPYAVFDRRGRDSSPSE